MAQRLRGWPPPTRPELRPGRSWIGSAVWMCAPGAVIRGGDPGRRSGRRHRVPRLCPGSSPRPWFGGRHGSTPPTAVWGRVIAVARACRLSHRTGGRTSDCAVRQAAMRNDLPARHPCQPRPLPLDRRIL
jgi:hypothetical protein